MDNTNGFTLIQFTQITKQGRRIVSTRPVWIATCAFKDGPGMRVKKMTTTPDMAKAARFSLASATEIAVQFSHLPASLVRPDGTVKEAETTALQAEQLRRHVALQQLKREMAEEWNAIFAPALAILKQTSARLDSLR